MCNSVCTLFKLLKQQDDSGVFLVYMEGVPGAIRQCIPRTHRRGEVLIMRRLMKRPCHHMGFPVSLVLATSRRQQQWVTAYNKKDSVYKFVRQLLALPFLPPEHIEETFLRLDGRAPEVLAPVMDYMCTGRGSVLPSSRSITGVCSWHPSGQTMMWRGVTTAWTPVLPLGDRFLSTIFCSSCTGKQPASQFRWKWCLKARYRGTKGRGPYRWKVVCFSSGMTIARDQ